MPGASEILLERLRVAFDAVHAGADPVLRPSDRADYQANGALPLARALGREAMDVAEEVTALADLDDVCSVVELSGQGFINLTLSDDFIAQRTAELSADRRLGVPSAAAPETIVIDYSSPNVAKEMHIGHLRSTDIGDSLARVFAFLGHDVRRENHIGDWGTPFGMLIEHLIDVGGADRAESFSVRDLNEFYTAARRPIRRRRVVRRAQPAPRRPLARRRPRDHAAVAHLRRREHAPRPRGLRPPRRASHRKGHRWGELLQP